MHMRKTVAKAMLFTVVGAAAIGASPALAKDLSAQRTGVKSWSAGSRGQIAVADTARDSKEVYANYNRRNADGLELRNSSGYGTTTYSSNQPANPVDELQACVAIDWNPDDCTVWHGQG
ncbi:hypothetical protein NLX86_30720 [Streptomyces sp. A3M-1-3]|uniref:hypothetical protein n=1 Tax=Streptomyces sp. A3M-1-3 TaxID=2962044 RepID=UPI0020B79663|nr:hypothetical protein [Streptomyces sp. A3M-1-3]MCP3822300.1 hypothetical protein [Streptomyces sp. A3M-1-3]